MMSISFHIKELPSCGACDKPTTHEVRNHNNALYGVFCLKHAEIKKKLLEDSVRKGSAKG
jgi:hypothetical protein